MPDFSTPTTEKVLELIAAGGGGDGAHIKSGISTAPHGLVKRVDFITPFLSPPRVVITPFDSTRRVWIDLVGNTYFQWGNDSLSVDVTIHWIATTAGNA